MRSPLLWLALAAVACSACGPLLATQQYDKYKGRLVTRVNLPRAPGKTDSHNRSIPAIEAKLEHTQGDAWAIVTSTLSPYLLHDPPTGCRSVEWSVDNRPLPISPVRYDLVQLRDSHREVLRALVSVSDLQALLEAQAASWRICGREVDLSEYAMGGLRDFVRKIGSSPAGRSDRGPSKAVRQLLEETRAATPDRPPASRPDPAGEIVAVFDVHDASHRLDDDVLIQLTTYLGTMMAQSGRYRVVPRDQLRRRLVDQKKGSYGSCYDESCQIELGKALAANKTLATTLIQVGKRCAVTANLFDLESETAVKGASVETGCATEDLLGAMKDIARQLSQ